MKVLRELTFGILSAAGSAIIVLGALTLAMAEGMTYQSMLPPEPVTPTRLVVLQGQPRTPEPTPMPNLPGVTLTASPQPTATFACVPPYNWDEYQILPGDNVNELAQRHDITAQTLRDANCLESDSLSPGSILHLPPLPPTATPPVAPPTITPPPCGPPWGWVWYTVRWGDTFFALSKNYGVSIYQIQHANCMDPNAGLKAGQRIYLPYVRPVRTAIPTATRTTTQTLTNVPPAQTATRTLTGVPSLTATPTPTFTVTSTNTPTQTFTVTPTSTPTATPTLTATSTVTSTNTPTITPTATITPTTISEE